jgi:23S rRNA A2030 N6-methylase RlmJ
MAEVLGTMASGIAIYQLATSIARSIIAIKQGWSQVQDAPTEINNLIRQIDSLNLILQHIQDDQSQEDIPQLSSANLCVQQSLGLCEEGAAELAALANDLNAKIQGKNR